MGKEIEGENWASPSAEITVENCTGDMTSADEDAGATANPNSIDGEGSEGGGGESWVLSPNKIHTEPCADDAMDVEEAESTAHPKGRDADDSDYEDSEGGEDLEDGEDNQGYEESGE